MPVHKVQPLSVSHFFLSLLCLLASLSSITATASPPSCSSSDLTTWEQIHQTLHTYPLAIDTKDFGLLATAVFAPTTTANYTGDLFNLTGIAAIQAGLAASVAKIDTQHLLGTTAISISNCTSANSTTYFQANLFGKDAYEGQVLYLYGLYADVLALVKGVGWRIAERTLVFQGPGMIGNASVIAQ